MFKNKKDKSNLIESDQEETIKQNSDDEGFTTVEEDLDQVKGGRATTDTEVSPFGDVSEEDNL